MLVRRKPAGVEPLQVEYQMKGRVSNAEKKETYPGKVQYQME